MKREGVTHTEGGEEAALRNTARAAEVFMPGYVCIAVPNGHAQKKKKKPARCDNHSKRDNSAVISSEAVTVLQEVIM